MKKLSLILFLSALTFSLSAQKFSKINFDSIKKHLSADTTLYSKLVERMKKMDSTLTHEEYITLYYGQVFSKTYNPYKDHEGKTEMRDKYIGRNYTAALTYFDQLIAANAFDLDVWYKAAVCYKETGNILMKKRCFRVFNSLLNCIEHSGDGLKCETGFVVMCRNDEYLLLSDYNIEIESETQIDKCDMIKLPKPKEGETPNEKFKGKKLYFNNYWSLKKMDDLLKGK